MMRRSLGIRGAVGMFAIASVVFASGATAAAGAARPSDVQVKIVHWRYNPKVVQVPAGTTVVWFNAQLHKHTSVSYDGLWKSGPIPPGGTFSYTFTAPGTYLYHCVYGKGFRGEVDVLPAGG